MFLDDSPGAIISLGYVGDPTASADELAWLQNLIDHVAVALMNVRREEKLYDQAHFDPLTRLPNRLLLEDRIEQAIGRAKRMGTSVAVLFMDVDRFKGINDSYGHSVGDEMLTEIAGRLLSGLRSTDSVARFGGDEFVILAQDIEDPEKLTTETAQIAEKLLSIVSSRFLVGARELSIRRASASQRIREMGTTSPIC